MLTIKGDALYRSHKTFLICGLFYSELLFMYMVIQCYNSCTYAFYEKTLCMCIKIRDSHMHAVVIVHYFLYP